MINIIKQTKIISNVLWYLPHSVKTRNSYAPREQVFPKRFSSASTDCPTWNEECQSDEQTFIHLADEVGACSQRDCAKGLRWNKAQLENLESTKFDTAVSLPLSILWLPTAAVKEEVDKASVAPIFVTDLHPKTGASWYETSSCQREKWLPTARRIAKSNACFPM